MGSGWDANVTYAVGSYGDLNILLGDFNMLHVFHVVPSKLQYVSWDVLEHCDQKKADRAVDLVIKHLLSR